MKDATRRCKKDYLTSTRYYKKGEVYEYKYSPECHYPHLVKSDGNGNFFSEKVFNECFENIWLQEK